MKHVLAQSLAFGDPGECFLLATYAGKYRVLHYKGTRVAEQYRVPSGMWMMASYRNPEARVTLVLSSQNGRTYIFQPGEKGKSIAIPTAGTGMGTRGRLGEMATIANTVYLVGNGYQIYRWEGAGWTDLGLGSFKPAVAGYKGIMGVLGTIDQGDLTSRQGHPTVCYEPARIFALDGSGWKLLDARQPKGYFTALHYDEANRAYHGIFTGASGFRLMIWPEDGRPKFTALDPKGYEPWDIIPFKGSWYVSNLDSIRRIAGQKLNPVKAPGGESSPHNHSMQVHEDKLYWVRTSGVHVFDGRSWASLPLPKKFA